MGRGEGEDGLRLVGVADGFGEVTLMAEQFDGDLGVAGFMERWSMCWPPGRILRFVFGEDIMFLCPVVEDMSLFFEAESSRSLLPLSSFFRASAASRDFRCMPMNICRTEHY